MKTNLADELQFQLLDCRDSSVLPQTVLEEETVDV